MSGRWQVVPHHEHLQYTLIVLHSVIKISLRWWPLDLCGGGIHFWGIGLLNSGGDYTFVGGIKLILVISLLWWMTIRLFWGVRTMLGGIVFVGAIRRLWGGQLNFCRQEFKGLHTHTHTHTHTHNYLLSKNVIQPPRGDIFIPFFTIQIK